MLSFVVLVLFYQKTYQEKIHNLITGDYPKAINITNTEVLLLHSAGHASFTKTLFNILPSNSQFFTDQYSNVFRLNDQMLVLVKNKTMGIIIFDSRLNILYRTPLTPAYPENTEEYPYQYAIISDMSFVITYVNYSYLCEIQDSKINIEELSIIDPLSTKLRCEYSAILNVLLCAYINANLIKFKIYDIELRTTFNELAFTIPFGQYPLIKANKNFNSFSICYIVQQNNLILNCRTLILKKAIVEPLYIISQAPTEYSEQIPTGSHYDMKYIGDNLFVVFKNFNPSIIQLAHLSPSNIKISSAWSTTSSIQHPFIFSIDFSVGYVFKRSTTEIQIELFNYPECQSEIKYSQISKQGTFELTRKQGDSSYFKIFEYPLTNSVLYQDGDIVTSNKKYQNPAFTYVNFFSPSKVVWLFTEITDQNLYSLLCRVTLMICYSSCKECDLNAFGTSESHQCTSCYNEDDDKYYPYSNNIKPNNCDKEPNNGFFLNSISKFERCNTSCASCVTSASNCSTCSENYYPLETDFSQCKTGKIDGYFRNENDAFYKKCYESCKTCNALGSEEKHNCLTCDDIVYSSGETISSSSTSPIQCYPFCSITSNIRDICITKTGTCPDDRKLLIQNTKKCVSKCTYITNSDGKTQFLFNYENSTCMLQCPDGYFQQYNSDGNNCQKRGGNTGDGKEEEDSTRLKIYYEVTANKSSISEVLFETANLTAYYDRIEIAQKENNGIAVDVIWHSVGNDYTLTFYRASDQEVNKRLYYNKKRNASAIDFTSFEKNKSIQLSNIVVIQWDIYRPNELTNQVVYQLYDFDSNPINDPSIQNQPINISYHLTDLNNTIIQNALMLSAKGINMFNASSPFYNDVCFLYKDDITARDVSVRDRIETFYPKQEVCETNCTFISIDELNQKALCQCQFDASFSNQINPNPPFPEKPQSNIETYNAVKCIYVVFDKEAVVTNASFWLFMVFIVIILFLSLCFIYSGMSYANNYVVSILTSNKSSSNVKKKYQNNNINNADNNNDEKIQISLEQ